DRKAGGGVAEYFRRRRRETDPSRVGEAARFLSTSRGGGQRYRAGGGVDRALGGSRAGGARLGHLVRRICRLHRCDDRGRIVRIGERNGDRDGGGQDQARVRVRANRI